MTPAGYCQLALLAATAMKFGRPFALFVAASTVLVLTLAAH